MSPFATPGRAKEPGEDDLVPRFDESRMERVLEELTREAGKMDEEDPRTMAGLMRKFSEKTGFELNEKMELALTRLEAGEDPDTIEREMGGILEGDDALPFAFKQAGKGSEPRPPVHDETLYDMDEQTGKGER
jgi:hypothetical protein